MQRKAGEPVGLAQEGKYPSLDVLEPEFGIDTKVFQNSISGNDKSGNQENLMMSFLNLSSR